jgi:hypothetical protein
MNSHRFNKKKNRDEGHYSLSNSGRAALAMWATGDYIPPVPDEIQKMIDAFDQDWEVAQMAAALGGVDVSNATCGEDVKRSLLRKAGLAP